MSIISRSELTWVGLDTHKDSIQAGILRPGSDTVVSATSGPATSVPIAGSTMRYWPSPLSQELRMVFRNRSTNGGSKWTARS
jgi:hypothetical protein